MELEEINLNHNDETNKEDLQDISSEIEIIIYEDEHILLTKNKLIIKEYYFPINKSKTILIKDIQEIEKINLNFFNGKYKFYGLNWKLWYFHLDKQRPQKEEGILIQIDNLIKPLITPNNLSLVYLKLLKLIKIKIT